MSDPVRVQLRDGQWADLRPVEEVTERGRRPIQRAIAKISKEGWELVKSLQDNPDAAAEPGATADLSDRDMDALSDVNDWCVVALVRAWSFPESVTIDAVLDRHPRDYELLRAACAPAAQSMFVDFSVDQADDAASPTGPSSE